MKPLTRIITSSSVKRRVHTTGRKRFLLTNSLRTEKNPFHDRISRLAYARNQYLELVLERYSEIQNEYDDCYMVVFDLDFTCEISFESIGNALSLHEHWDVNTSSITSNIDKYPTRATLKCKCRTDFV
jgi:hypothetical protein